MLLPPEVAPAFPGNQRGTWLPQRSATDDDDWAHCPHPSTRLRARRLLREEKRRPPPLIVDFRKANARHLWSFCLEMDFGVHGPGLHTGVPMLPTAFTGCVSLERFVIFLLARGVEQNLKMTEIEGPKFRPVKLSGRCVARFQWVSPGVSTSLSPQIGHD